MASTQPRLHRAAAKGEKASIRQYLNAGDNVNARDADGRTALLESVIFGHTKCVEILLAAGADPSMSDNEEFFPLYIAAQNQNITIAKALIRANANVDAIIENPKGGTALFKAAYTGNKAMVRLLLDAGTDTSKTSAGGRHPLTIASGKGHGEVVSMLIDAGADLSAMCSDGITALLAAAQEGFCGIIRRLLEGGANVNQPGGLGRTALHMAAQQGFDAVINILIAAGAAVDQLDENGGTPLHFSALYRHPKCAWALLRAGSNVLAVGHEGYTPLHLAAIKGHTDVIEVLLSGGAQSVVNREDDEHRTPLALASSFADVKAVHLLLDAGADLDYQNALGKTALWHATDIKIVKALLDRGANVKLVNKYGQTVLHFAGFHGLSAGVICALFKGGADPTVKDSSGTTAADWARHEGHEDAGKLLDLLEAKHRATHST